MSGRRYLVSQKKIVMFFDTVSMFGAAFCANLPSVHAGRDDEFYGLVAFTMLIVRAVFAIWFMC